MLVLQVFARSQVACLNDSFILVATFVRFERDFSEKNYRFSEMQF